VKSFKKNRFDDGDEAAAKVENRLGYFIDKWGYERPGLARNREESTPESTLERVMGARHGEDAV